MENFDIKSMSQSERLALILSGLRALQGQLDTLNVNEWSVRLLDDEGLTGISPDDIDTICEAINTDDFNLTVSGEPSADDDLEDILKSGSSPLPPFPF